MPTPLIIDTDPGVDDVLAILLALASPEVSVKALTLTFGNTTLDYAYSNVLRTGAVLQQHLSDASTPQQVKDRFVSFRPDAEPILVALGAEQPLGGQRFTASYFHGRDGLSGLHSLPDDPFPAPSSPPLPFAPTDRSASQVMLDVLREQPEGTVRIAALGPLTNLALACQQDPATFARVGGISVMGCALDVPGNTSAVAEFNTFADPWAARFLFEEAPLDPALNGRRLPIDLIPLDITSYHTIPYSRLVTAPHGCSVDPQAEAELERTTHPSVLERYISTFLTHPRMVTNGYATPEEFHPDKHDLFQAHDPLAVAHAVFVPVVGPSSQQQQQQQEAGGAGAGWKHSLRRFRVECSGDVTRGMCVVDRRGLNNLAGLNKALDDPHAERVIAKVDEPSHSATGSNGVDAKKARQNGKADDEDPVGLVNVVVETPGVDWFASMFLERLGL
ncbi:uncharacterized protein PFL1_03019 [Pseudozyma flocculosa PF-1]|uniref:Related to Inosine-uridine preferring nucleoside hydrolase n=2 Tax=Pseudozyma flocculosa TaxID=84751 RepID=A0A5C3F005_9BASI|nr:uncharacterized protein PFL1_03019 [Pseudozyma flocculosa PF-1]EPQ29264.1 hypothetical protein PFL1_03019 [Pseudozyma flocculosa PF-1]SPO37768.1 related to Inosine-uridine preferring nucleoside hydrolase [Pseudozyma flocculosa]